MVRWTAHAKAQLRHIHNYIAEDSLLYAKRVTEALVQRTVDLDTLPRKGKIVSELNEEVIRERSLYSYRILYEIKSADLVVVLALIHKRQHLESDDVPRQ